MHRFNLIFVFFSLIAFAACLPTVQDTVSATALNLTELAERQAGNWQNWPNVNYAPWFGSPYCLDNNPDIGDQCILTNRMPEGNPDHTSWYLYDHNCVLIGQNENVPYYRDFCLDSQLPFAVCSRYVTGGMIGFGYSNRYYNQGNFDEVRYYNTGGPNALLPAVQMYFRCSTR